MINLIFAVCRFEHGTSVVRDHYHYAVAANSIFMANILGR
jgi:hypothetical protein